MIMLKKIFDFTYKYDNSEKIILRDFLALERTRLANERTLLAYIRASLNLLVAALAFFQLDGLEKIKWLGYPSVVFSIIFAVLGIMKYYQLKKQLTIYYSKSNDEWPEEIT
jgi:putative membrane protein